MAHTFVFNIRGRTFYNPGMLTSFLLFLPIAGYFFYFIALNKMGRPIDYLIGIPLGITANILGIVKTIEWLKNE